MWFLCVCFNAGFSTNWFHFQLNAVYTHWKKWNDSHSHKHSHTHTIRRTLDLPALQSYPQTHTHVRAVRVCTYAISVIIGNGACIFFHIIFAAAAAAVFFAVYFKINKLSVYNYIRIGILCGAMLCVSLYTYRQSSYVYV